MPDDQTTLNHHLTPGESLAVEGFAKKYGEGHTLLACHAAFPMVLTADLVYKIWQNFRNYADENGNLCEIPYVAVSDLLLSPLCQPSGFQRFEMATNIRHGLLSALQEDPRFGKARLHELASFLKHYIEAAYRDADAIGQAIRNAQQLVVDAWLHPEKALQSLTEAFRSADQSPAEQVRLSNLVAHFDQQWDAGLLAEDRQKPAQTRALLQYSRGLSAFHKTGDAHYAANLLKGVVQKGDSGMMLPLPGEVKTTVSNHLTPPKKGKLYALLIALDEYDPNSKIPPLRGCKNDAGKLATWLKNKHQSADSPWSAIQVETIFDEQVTLAMLEKRAEILQTIEAEDQVLIYFAGHASYQPDSGTELICYDARTTTNTPQLHESRFRRLISSNARQQPYITVVLDAEFTGSPNWLDPMNPKHVVFANSGLSENGYEISGQEGFFSKYFLAALEQGSGDTSNAALFLETLTGMATDQLSEKQHPQFYATPFGAERPFLQALDPARELKRMLRLSGASLADLRKQLNIPDSATKQFWKAALTTYLSEKEKTDTPLFLFVFSDVDGRLPGVKQERDQIKSLVEVQLQNTTVEAVFLENPDFEALQTYFTAPEYRNRLHLFHFSGLEKEIRPNFTTPRPGDGAPIKKAAKKAPPIQQQSNVGSMPEEPARFGLLLADGLLPFFEFAPWLEYQTNLRLAFFNSCFSNQMAAWATQLGVWNAIGTEGNVNDLVAAKFGVGFYSKWLVGGSPMLGAFSRVVETFRYDTEPLSGGTHRSALREEASQVPENDVPFQLLKAAWLTTGWRGERFTDYHLISDTRLRALVFEYDSLDISDKRERVAKKAQLAHQLGEIINSVVADRRVLVGAQASQGLLVGILNAVYQRPGESDAALLLQLAPLITQLFVKFEWVTVADGLLKQGMWPEARKQDLEKVLKGFEEGADEDLRGAIHKLLEKIDFSEPEMVFVNGGTFEMGWIEGRDEVGLDYEKPARKVAIKSFYLSKYPVTQGQWQAIMGSNPGLFNLGDNYPIENVSWNDVQEFIKRLNEKMNVSSSNRQVYYLPSSAEWEYAARGGIESKGLPYAGSNNIDEVAWYWNNSEEKTHPVGLKKANEIGLHDMSGNIWEWVEDDWYDDYETSPLPENGAARKSSPERSAYRVCRGGCWASYAVRVRCANSSFFQPEYAGPFVGFRLAKTMPTETTDSSGGKNERITVTTDYIKELQRMIASGQAEAAIHAVLDHTASRDEKNHLEALHFSSRWESINRMLRLGTISNDKANVEQSQIVAGLLEFIGRL